MTTLLRAEGVEVEFGGRSILKAVDLELRRGEVTTLIGPNGAGKTTLLEVLAGLDRPARGTVGSDGTIAAALQGAALARRTVLQNVELALAWWGIPRAARTHRARAALERVGAGHLADQPARTLSGGEARRVHLARALAVEPDVLLLDEPFAGLDLATRADLLYTTQDAIRDDRRATLVVVHDRAEAWALADRVIVMLGGSIAAQGAPIDVFLHPPSLDVARFVGFVGTITDGDDVLALRPSDVRIDPGGPHLGHIRTRIPIEDGIRLHVELDHGDVVVVADPPGPTVGETVRFSTIGGERFRRADGYPAGEAE